MRSFGKLIIGASVLAVPVSAGELSSIARASLAEAKAALAANPELAFDPTSILVKFREGTSGATRADIRALVLGESLREFSLVPGLEQVRVLGDVETTLAILNGLPSVEYAEPDYVVRTCVTPNDTYKNRLWGMDNRGQNVNGDPGVVDADIDAYEAWDSFRGTGNFVIAVIDTGVQGAHADLAGNRWVNSGEIAGNGVDDDGNGYIDDVNGYDFFDNDANPADSNGHGTHCAGTIGAVGNNGVGVMGVNWYCKIMALRFIGPGGGFTSDAIEAVGYAANKGVKVSSNSWGGGGYSASLETAINNAKSVGHIFVCAAGNGGSDGVGDNNDSSPFYPSSYGVDNLISVAATTNDDTRAGFSNYGLTSVDIGAPGVDVYSTYSGGTYKYLSGTSMATPHVAGVVAMVYQVYPAFTYQQARARVFSTARPIAALSGRVVTGGVANLQAAIAGGTFGSVPAAPGRPTIRALAGYRANVEWSDNSSNETGFEVQRERLVNSVWTDQTSVGFVGANVVEYNDSTFAAGTYRWRVRSFNGAGWSTWSDYRQLTLTN